MNEAIRRSVNVYCVQTHLVNAHNELNAMFSRCGVQKRHGVLIVDLFVYDRGIGIRTSLSFVWHSVQ